MATRLWNWFYSKEKKMIMRILVVACCVGGMAHSGYGQYSKRRGRADVGQLNAAASRQFNNSAFDGVVAIRTSQAGWFGWSEEKSQEIRDRMSQEEDEAVRERFEAKFVEKMTELIEREDLVRRQELKRLEARIAKLKSSLAEREASHESIARERFEAFMSGEHGVCLLYTSPSPRDATLSRMPSSA